MNPWGYCFRGRPAKEPGKWTSSEIPVLACGVYMTVWDNVRGAVGGGEEWGPPVLLLDDFSVVLSLWVSVGAALDFSHYCRATVCSELQVEVCWRGQCDRQQTQKKLFQYKVHDKGAFFFTRGMSSAVP